MRLDPGTGATALDEVFARQDVPAEEGVDRTDRTPDGPGARERFGGMNLGACFFGWLVAIASAVLLVSLVGGALTAVGTRMEFAQSDAEQRAGTVGIAAGATLLVVLLIGYYAGGYVGGRMSRFDGGRQGVGVWAIGLIVTVLAVGAGAIVGAQYDLVDRVDLDGLSVTTEQLGWGAAITAVSLVVGTLLAAALGGVIGRHYHDRVDRAVSLQ
ncbi:MULTISPECIES: hypothetical protein [unclassified Nocardioides]|uniref:hypothetical protein n=1 Tax=unclassified Nocardioides TaxID=2615069 RepID=UPI00361FC99B